MYRHITADSEKPLQRNAGRTIGSYLRSIMLAFVMVTGTLTGCSVATVSNTTAVQPATNEDDQERESGYDNFVAKYVESATGMVGINNDTFASMFKSTELKAKYQGRSVYVSEGYGYGTLIADAQNDQRLFTDIYNTVRAQQFNNPNHLLPWAVNENQQPIIDQGMRADGSVEYITGTESAADGDIDTLAGFVLGFNNDVAGVWKFDTAFRDDLRTNIINYAYTYMDHTVASLKVGDTTFLVQKPTDAAWCIGEDGGVTVFTSYLAPGWYELIARFLETQDIPAKDTKGLAAKYRQLKTDTYTLIALSQPKGVVDQAFPAKVVVKAGKTGITISPAAADEITATGRSAYELVRLPWRLAIDQRWYGATPVAINIGGTGDDSQSTVVTLGSNIAGWGAGKAIEYVLPAASGKYFLDTLDTLYAGFIDNALTPQGVAAHVGVHDYTRMQTGNKRPDLFFGIDAETASKQTKGLSVPEAQFVIDKAILEDTVQYPIGSEDSIKAARVLLKGVSSILSYTDDATRFSRAGALLEYIMIHGYGAIQYYTAPLYISVMRDNGVSTETIINSLSRIDILRDALREKLAAVPGTDSRQTEYATGSKLIRDARIGMITQERYYPRMQQQLQNADAFLAKGDAALLDILNTRVQKISLLLSLQASPVTIQTAITEAEKLIIQSAISHTEQNDQKIKQLQFQLAFMKMQNMPVADQSRAEKYQALLKLYIQNVFDYKGVLENGNSTEAGFLANSDLVRGASELLLGGLDSDVGRISPLRPNLPLPVASRDDAKSLLLSQYSWIADNALARIYAGEDALSVKKSLDQLLLDPQGDEGRLFSYITGQAVPGVFDEGLHSRFPIDLKAMATMRYGYTMLTAYKSLGQASIETKMEYRQAIEKTVDSLLGILQNPLLKKAEMTDTDIEVVVMSAQKILFQLYEYEYRQTGSATEKQVYVQGLTELAALHPRLNVYLGYTRVADSADKRIQALQQAILDIRLVQTQSKKTLTFKDLQLKYPLIVSALGKDGLQKIIQNYDAVTRSPAKQIQINPRYDLRGMRPQNITIDAWNGFRGAIVPYGYFDNIAFIAPYASEIAETLFWTNDPSLQGVALKIMDGINADYESKTAGDVTGGVGNPRFFATYYTMLLNMLQSNNDASLSYAREAFVTQGLSWPKMIEITQQRITQVINDQGPHSADVLRTMTLLTRMITAYPDAAGDAAATKAWQTTYDAFMTMAQGDANLTENTLPSMIEIAKNLVDVRRSSYGAADVKVQRLVQFLKNNIDRFERMDLLTGTLKYWVYITMYETTKDGYYLQRLEQTANYWSTDATLVQYLEEKNMIVKGVFGK